jgi:hypothetical protein
MPHKRSSSKSAKKPYAKPTSEESSKLKATKELRKSEDARPPKTKMPDEVMGQTVDMELSLTAVERANKKAARVARKQAKMDHLDANAEGMRMRPGSCKTMLTVGSNSFGTPRANPSYIIDAQMSNNARDEEVDESAETEEGKNQFAQIFELNNDDSYRKPRE